jgi:anti-sigma B factor antagonist
MSQGRHLHLTLDSNLEGVDAAESLVSQVAGESGFPDDDIGQISMAVRETVVNAVTHGNGYSKDKQVFFSVAVDAGRLRITVRDQGEGFNPGDVPDPTAGDNILRTSGRGLLLMRAFMDDVIVRAGAAGGTEVVLVKSLPDRPGRGEEESKVSLSASIREVDGVSILDLSGRITLGEGSGKLRDTVREVLGTGQKKILINLRGVDYIDSSGLGELVSSYTTAANQGAKVKLCNVKEKVDNLLQITKLYTVFEILNSESEAIISF